MKPRVRLIHDKQRSPVEVRVIIAPPTQHTKTFDEFNGLVKVTADEVTKSVQSISLDCNLLGGKQYEETMLELLAWMKMAQNRKGVPRETHLPRRVDRVLRKCKALCTADRVDAVIERIKVDQQRKWGKLHPLLDKVFANDHRDGGNPVVALTDFVKGLGENWLAVMEELVATCIEDFRTGNHIAYQGNQAALTGLVALDNGHLHEFALFVAKERQYDGIYWRLFIDAIFATYQDDLEKFNICKEIYYTLRERQLNSDKDENAEFPEENTRYMMIEYSESPALNWAGDEEQIALAKSFYEEVEANDPEENIKALAKAMVAALEGDDDGDEGYGIDNLDAPHDGPNEIADPGIPLFPPMPDVDFNN